jgi:hypothetical protein
VQSSYEPVVPKNVFLGGVIVASALAFAWITYYAFHHHEFFVPVHVAVVLLALVWMVHAHYPSLFSISMRDPGALQVGLEVAVLSSLAYGIPWVIAGMEWGPLTPAPWGVLLLILSMPAAAMWVGLRTRLRARTYVVAQSMIAALCFYPVWLLGMGLLGFAIDPGFSGLREPWLAALRAVQRERPAEGVTRAQATGCSPRSSRARRSAHRPPRHADRSRRRPRRSYGLARR